MPRPSTQQISPNPSMTSPLPSSIPVPNALDSPDYIPRPRNAFIIFRADRSKKYQGRTAGDISQLVAVEWKYLSPDIRARYEHQADEEKQRHKALYPHYRFQPKQKPKVKDMEERKKLETRVTEKMEERRAQKRAARARAKKTKLMERAMRQTAPVQLPMSLVYPSQLDSTSHLPFIPVLIPNPAYLPQIPTTTLPTHTDSAVPLLPPLSPPSPAEHALDSGPVTPVVAGSPVRVPLEVITQRIKGDSWATALSPIIASASPIQPTATFNPFHEWALDPLLPLCGSDTFTHEGPYAWFDWSMPSLSNPEFCGPFYSNSFGSTSSLQLSEASNDSGDLSTLMDAFGPGAVPWDMGAIFNPPVPYTTPAVGFTGPTLTPVSLASSPTSATAGRTRRSIGKEPSPGPDGWTHFI